MHLPARSVLLGATLGLAFNTSIVHAESGMAPDGGGPMIEVEAGVIPLDAHQTSDANLVLDAGTSVLDAAPTDEVPPPDHAHVGCVVAYRAAGDRDASTLGAVLALGGIAALRRRSASRRGELASA